MTNNTEWQTQYLSLCLSSVPPTVFLPLHPFPPPLFALHLSAIRQIVAGLICIVSPTIPIGAPHSCLLKDSGATAPSHSPMPWIKLTLGQHQHIMNYGHLPPQTHCSLCSNVKNMEGTGELSLLTAYSLSYLNALCACEKWTVGLHWDVSLWVVIGSGYLCCILTFTQVALPCTDETREVRLTTLLYIRSGVGNKGVDPDSDPTRAAAHIWLPPNIQSAWNTWSKVKQTVKSQAAPLRHLKPVWTQVSGVFIIMMQSPVREIKNDLISEDESVQHRYNQFLLFSIFQKAHTQWSGQTNGPLPLQKTKGFLWTRLITTALRSFTPSPDPIDTLHVDQVAPIHWIMKQVIKVTDVQPSILTGLLFNVAIRLLCPNLAHQMASFMVDRHGAVYWVKIEQHFTSSTFGFKRLMWHWPH